MFTIRYVCEEDKEFWYTLDKHLSINEFILKCRDKRGYIISDNEMPIGIMRYNLFWDMVPFLTFIYIDDARQNKGFGKKAVFYWENEMRNLGYEMLMTSTQANEEAQHFYRKLGYIDRGGIFLDNTPFEQPQEMLLIKVL
jgi:Acetyltransferases